MKLSLRWLNEYTKIEETPSVLADKISASLAEVEDIHEIHDTFEGVLIGKILEVTKHPNADTLQLTQVDVGHETLSIVCGATNISVGDLVPVILVGSTLPGADMAIEAREVRGEVSHGMLCSPHELGISHDHSGILLLNKEKDAKIGQRFDSLFETHDIVFEIENKALTHRPDAFSHAGIARELAAMFDAPYEYVKLDENPLKLDQASSLTVDVQNEALCRRYSGVIVPGVQIAASPLWMQSRLHRIGVRTRNNLVDITNYVMHDMGQPLHAFDRDTLTSDTVIVRNATENEHLVTLDEQERKLTPDMLVIADEDQAIALAGIMGGIDTEISDTTTELIVESANFEHFNNRKTSRLLGLQTDASVRFSKNQDPSLTLPALYKTLHLLQEYANAESSSSLVDITHEQTYIGREKRIIPFTPRYINNTISNSQDISETSIKQILRSLDITVIDHESRLGAQPPTSRPDITIPEDLVEEVARIIGYDEIEPTLPTRDLTPASANQHVLWVRRVKESLARAGLSEVYNYSFVGTELYKKCNLDNLLSIKLANPVASEHEYMRPTLLPQLLQNIADNTKHHQNISLFELERVHEPNGIELPQEHERIGIALYKSEFSYMKGIVETILSTLHIPNIHFELPVAPVSTQQLFDPNRVTQIWSEDTYVGVLGEIQPSVQSTFDLDVCSIAELDANALYALTDTGTQYMPVSSHPELSYDISLVIQESTSSDSVINQIHALSLPLLKSATIFDTVKDTEKFGEDNKSITLHLVFQSHERTLSKKDILHDIQNIEDTLKNTFST